MAAVKGFTVYLTSWQRGMLDKIGTRQDRSPSAVARRFIRRGIKREQRRLVSRSTGKNAIGSRC